MNNLDGLYDVKLEKVELYHKNQKIILTFKLCFLVDAKIEQSRFFRRS